MHIAEFLTTVVHGEGNFCLATRAPSDAWREEWFTWPNELDRIVDLAQVAARTSNVYFSAHLFSEASSRKEFVLPSRTIQADLDNAEVATIPVVPTVLVTTSPGRHQGYWITDKAQPLDKLEALGRRIAYGVPDCDKTGWSAGHKVRLPGTYNLKYDKPHFIEVAGLALRALDLEVFNIFPESNVELSIALEDIAWVRETPERITVPAMELLAALKGKINPRAYTQYNKRSRDRSAALWLLTCEAFRAGCTRDQVYHLALNSANNKFEDRRFNALTDLRKDILRAERYIITKAVDLKALMMDLRHTKGDLVAARRKKMAELAINTMREAGEFVHTKGGGLWFLNRQSGRPVLIASHSEWLNTYLSTTFGFNYTEQEHKYVVQELITYTRSMPQSNDLQTLSYYDSYRGVLLLHTGGRDVLHISPTGVSTHPNGYGSIVFQWGILGETFSYDSTMQGASPWWVSFFEGCLDNIIGLEREESLALLRAWFLFLLFRHVATTRPLLALFGQPGSGKTTTAKMFYRLIYGHYKSLSGLNNAEDFDMDVASMPFVCFDNCDTWQPWLPDRLAQSAGNTVIGVRKLYTDMDVIYRERQALVAVTAHNPKFAREDITDRLLLFMFQRLPFFKSETEILERISLLRGNLWNGIIQDVSAVLRTPKPLPHEIPQFRIEDYARLGAWFSKAVDPAMLAAFQSGVTKIQSRQKAFNIEEDYTLVAAIRRWLDKRAAPALAGADAGFLPASTLWLQLSSFAPDPEAFKKQYRSAQILGRKLWVMQESLKTIINIETKDSASLGTRVWKLGVKDTDARGT